MADLAFLSRPESLDQVPAETRVLPVSPHVGVPPARCVAASPEAFLGAPDLERIERSARALAHGWWKAPGPSSLVWRSVDLGECFENDFLFVARDLLKASALVERAFDRESPSAVVTDVSMTPSAYPPYPYLHGLGRILRAMAGRSGIPLHVLPGAARGGRPRRPSRLVRAYSVVAARRAITVLRSERPLLVIGPLPDFYEPLARAWSAGGGATVAASSAAAPLRARPASGLYFAPFEAFVTSADDREIQSFVASALASLRNPQPPTDHISEWELGGPLIGQELKARLAERLRDLAREGVAFDGGLGSASHVLLMETHTPMTRAARRYADAKKLPVTVLQHGVIADPESYARTESRRIAAWGPRDAAWFRDALPHPVEVEPTGNPRYDSLASSQPEGRTPELDDVPAHAAVILFASAPFGHPNAAASPWERYALRAMAAEALVEIEDAILVFKRHPAEAPEPLPEACRRRPDRFRELAGGNTIALIQRSRAVLSMGSTVALEAMNLDRPAIFLGDALPGSPFRPPEEGGGLRARTRQELANQIRRLLGDESFRRSVLSGQRAYLARAFAPLDGKSAMRVVAFLRKTPSSP